MATIFGDSGRGMAADMRHAGLASRGWRSLCALLAWLGVLAFSAPVASGGTLVNFNTTVGAVSRTIQVDLFDDVTPETVANFLNYVNNNRYEDTIVHRHAVTFVLQGGGYKTADFLDPLPFQPPHIPTFASPMNEFQISNNRAGTIAMAKRGDDPNSATSEWFFNLKDNSANLDNQNGGFTVFGWTVGNGLALVSELATLAPTEVPFAGFPGSNPQFDPFTTVPVDGQGNFVNVDSISIAMTHPSFQNPLVDTDVNNDGQTTPNDVVVIVNSLLANGSHEASAEFVGDTYKYFDTNGDGLVRPSDLLKVANFILSRPSAAPASAGFAAPMQVVPEPSTLSLAMGAALALSAVAIARRRRRKHSAAGIPA